MKPQSRISVNIHGQNVPDVAYLKEWLVRLNPAWVLVMDNFGLCLEIKALLPECNVIHRGWGADGDDNDHQQHTPGAWVAQKLTERGDADIWCYTTNEPEFGPEVMRWHVEVMKLAAGAGLKLVVGNFGVGKPEDVDHDWEQAETMLRLLDMHRETMVLGLHEYACGVITSGFIGGNPAELGLIMPDTWPEDTTQIGALWHCGRFRFVEKFCETVGIKPPRIVITEHGFDDVSDIKSWTETLVKTATLGNLGGNIRGWKTLENQWNAWFGNLGWLRESAYFEQLQYADRKIYQGSIVEAQLIFCWGHSSDIWQQFDIAETRTLHNRLVDYAEAPTPTPPGPPVGEPPGETLPLPFPFDWAEWETALLKPVNEAVNIRVNAGTQYGVLATVDTEGGMVSYAKGYPGDWVPVQFDSWRGWVHRDYAVFVPPPESDIAQLKARVATLEAQIRLLVEVHNKLVEGLGVFLYKIGENAPHP